MHTDRKTEIQEAFMRLVSRFGLDKTTMQDIAREAGISVGVIYKDFKNKEELIEAYIVNKEQQFASCCRELLRDELPAEEMLHHLIRGMFENMARMTLEDRGFWQFCQNVETIKILRKNYDRRRGIVGELLEMIEMIMTKGVREGCFDIEDIPITAQLFLRAFSEFWKEIFLGRDTQVTLNSVDLMFGFLCKAIRKK